MIIIGRLGAYETTGTIEDRDDIKLFRSKVVAYDLSEAFEQNYFKVLRAQDEVIIKMIRESNFNENEFLAHTEQGRSTKYHIYDQGEKRLLGTTYICLVY